MTPRSRGARSASAAPTQPKRHGSTTATFPIPTGRTAASSSTASDSPAMLPPNRPYGISSAPKPRPAPRAARPSTWSGSSTPPASTTTTRSAPAPWVRLPTTRRSSTPAERSARTRQRLCRRLLDHAGHPPRQHQRAGRRRRRTDRPMAAREGPLAGPERTARSSPDRRLPASDIGSDTGCPQGQAAAGGGSRPWVHGADRAHAPGGGTAGDGRKWP